MSHEYNVQVAVVQLVTADSAAEATAALSAQLTAAGFDVYTQDAFHSETCQCGTDQSTSNRKAGT
jgi:hypothetical protein